MTRYSVERMNHGFSESSSVAQPEIDLLMQRVENWNSVILSPRKYHAAANDSQLIIDMRDTIRTLQAQLRQKEKHVYALMYQL